jgi:hypothetical protein
MMQVPSAGAFVRALLPVKLAGGYTMTYGSGSPSIPQTFSERSRSGGSVLREEWPHTEILELLP